MTIIWQILDTKRKIEDGLIVEVVYSCIANLDGEISRKIGSIYLTGDSTAPDFVPFNTLTESTIVTWVKNSLGEVAVTEIEDTLQANVEAQKAAKDAETEKNGLPWL
jgi:hypothetical protein